MIVFVPGGRCGLDGLRSLAFKSTVTTSHGAPGHPATRTAVSVGYMSGLEHVQHGDTIERCG